MEGIVLADRLGLGVFCTGEPCRSGFTVPARLRRSEPFGTGLAPTARQAAAR